MGIKYIMRSMGVVQNRSTALCARILIFYLFRDSHVLSTVRVVQRRRKKPPGVWQSLDAYVGEQGCEGHYEQRS